MPTKPAADYITAIINTAESTGRFSPLVAEYLRAILPAACEDIDALRGVAGPDAALAALTELTGMLAGWTISGCGLSKEDALIYLGRSQELVRERMEETL